MDVLSRIRPVNQITRSNFNLTASSASCRLAQ
jgi:hypothetical protein